MLLISPKLPDRGKISSIFKALVIICGNVPPDGVQQRLASGRSVRARWGAGGRGDPAARFDVAGLEWNMRGTVRKISIPRRLVADLMHASIGVPFVSLTRVLNVRPLLEARALAAQPPGWAAIFVKAFALVAKDEPVLRTLYAKWPWPSFYELPRSIAMVAIARVEDGQDCVLPQKVTAPR